MNPKKLVIASRESLLAMWQAKHIQGRLKTRHRVFQTTFILPADRHTITGAVPFMDSIRSRYAVLRSSEIWTGLLQNQ